MSLPRVRLRRRPRARRAPHVTKLTLERLATAVVQAVNGRLGPAHAPADLRRREPDDVPHQHDLALFGGQRLERLLESPAAFLTRVVGRIPGPVHLLA